MRAASSKAATASPAISSSRKPSPRGEARALPLSPCGRGWLREAKTGEGSLSANSVFADRDPSSGASRHLLPQGEKEESSACALPTNVDGAVPNSAAITPPYVAQHRRDACGSDQGLVRI